MTLFGVDGCRAGWLAAVADGPDAVPSFALFPTFAELAAAVTGAGGVAAVDVPIGLADGPRACDGAARAILGMPRASSVFSPPARSALDAATPEEARRRNLATAGRSLSAQTLNLVAKIAEADRVMTPALQRAMVEAHPELAFARLHPAGRGLPTSKKTRAGRAQRLWLLPPPLRQAALELARPPFPRAQVAADDYLDALALLVTAARVAGGTHARLPAGAAERDARGLRMEIAY